MEEIGRVENLHPFLVANEGVTELDLNRCVDDTRMGLPTTEGRSGCFGSFKSTPARPASQPM